MNDSSMATRGMRRAQRSLLIADSNPSRQQRVLGGISAGLEQVQHLGEGVDSSGDNSSGGM
jgi:hypothetical protein